MYQKSKEMSSGQVNFSLELKGGFSTAVGLGESTWAEGVDRGGKERSPSRALSGQKRADQRRRWGEKKARRRCCRGDPGRELLEECVRCQRLLSRSVRNAGFYFIIIKN